jgi:hypothetical protein
MTKKRLGEKPEKPEAVFEITGETNHKIPVEVYMAVPLELAHEIEIRQYVEGDNVPSALDFLHIDRVVYTGEYVVSDLGCVPLIIAKDKEHFIDLLKERVLPHYDRDLVKKIEVIVR